MSDHIQKTIAELQARIMQEEETTLQKKRVVNDLCGMAGMPVIYGDADLKPKATISSFRSDQFYCQPLTASVRQILEARQSANLGPATIYEIFDVLKAGGYAIEGSEEDTRRGVAISIAKNTTTFHRLPNDKIGLMIWYPEAKKKKADGQESQTPDVKTDQAGKTAKPEEVVAQQPAQTVTDKK